MIPEQLTASVARVFVTNGRPWERLLDAAAARIGGALGELCLIGVGDSAATVFGPIGVYHHQPERLLRINETPAFVWPVSERASRVLESGEPFFSDGSTDISEVSESALWGPWQDALGDAGPFAYMMAPIRFAGASIGLLAVARELPAELYTQAHAHDLDVVLDILALALHGLQSPAQPAAGYVAARVTRSAVAMLNDRERSVLALLAEGLTNAEIGTRLYLSERTIEWYRSRILEKLDHPTRAELVALGRAFRG